MTPPQVLGDRSHRQASRSAFRWIGLLTLALIGLVALLPIAPATADNVAATATVCVPGPDNFCPATPTAPPPGPLRLYLTTIQQGDLPLP